MFGLSCAPQLRAYQHLCMQSSTSIYICANKIIFPTKLSCVCFRGTKSEFGIYFQLGCPSSEWLMVSCPSLRSTESQLNFVLDEQPCWLMNYFNMLLSNFLFFLYWSSAAFFSAWEVIDQLSYFSTSTWGRNCLSVISCLNQPSNCPINVQ